MPATDADTPARDAIDAFIRSLDDRGFAASTRRLRRRFLDEYLRHALRTAETPEMTVGELLDPARTDAWLADAGAGKTRVRNTLRGPEAAAYPNSMRVRVDSFNAFAEFTGLAERIDGQRP
ncbi:MAG TPA: hypothetical protein VK719_12280, partial [Trebonia sp.]|nr:hypothetical protein [Trebonia sp.]